jgi:hypothetical protein
MDKDKVAKLLNDFSEYCHTRYLGCSSENGKYLYSYDTEVVIMAEAYLKTLPEPENQLDVEMAEAINLAITALGGSALLLEQSDREDFKAIALGWRKAQEKLRTIKYTN